MTIEEDECFGNEFFSNLVAFIEETRKNAEAQGKVEKLKNLAKDFIKKVKNEMKRS